MLRAPTLGGQVWSCADCLGPDSVPGEWDRRGRCGGPIAADCEGRAYGLDGTPIEPPQVSGGRVVTAAGASLHRETYRSCPVALAKEPWVERVAELEAALDVGAELDLTSGGWQAVRWWRTLRAEPSASEARSMERRP